MKFSKKYKSRIQTSDQLRNRKTKLTARGWEARLEKLMNPKPKKGAGPNTNTLQVLMEEYLEMLGEAERGVKKVLALKPETEKFWDALTEVSPHVAWVGIRSDSIEEEITDLIDQLPED